MFPEVEKQSKKVGESECIIFFPHALSLEPNPHINYTSIVYFMLSDFDTIKLKSKIKTMAPLVNQPPGY